MEKIFFQSSLPRSGSTTLQNLLAQNPDFYVSPASGLLELLLPAKEGYALPEFKARNNRDNEKSMKGFCEAAIKGYYNAITNKKYVMDKNKKWGLYRDFLNSFYPEPKMVCMVRDLRDVFSSLEKQFRKNQFRTDGGIRNPKEMQGTSLPKRVDMWMSNPSVGLALESLNDIVRQGYDDKILFIKYENLNLYPESEMTRLYQYLDIPAFEHDFDNIKKVTLEDDEVYSMYDEGTLGTEYQLKRKPSDYKLVLGADVSDWLYTNFEWFYKKFDYKK
jgi:sulfotransferase